MKKFFKILFYFVLVVVIGFIVAMFFTFDLTHVADSFFNKLKNGNYQEAQEYLSEEFKKSTSIVLLKERLPYEKFKNYSDCSFSKRTKNADGTAKLEGKIEFSNGSSIPVQISFIKENDQWKINHLLLPPSGIEQSGNDYNKLVHITMLALIKGITENNYTDFYALASENFKKQVPESKLTSVFSKFSNAAFNWNNVKNLKPIIRKKKRLKNGFLRIEGYYQTTPNNLDFKFEYSNNNGNWKVEGAFLRFE